MTATTEPRRFTKHVAIKELDEDERTATGAVLVPFEVDRQGDWLRPEGVHAMYNPDVDDGVMHARFPDDAAELVDVDVADEPITLGDKEYPAGTWYATRQYHDDELWGLVRDGILAGFSIGGEISDDVEYSSVDELPDEVDFPDGVDADEFDSFTEIVNGFTREVSDVDIPAVPRAMYSTAKSLEKNLVDELNNRDDFVEVFSDRGHTENEAGRLYDVLDRFEKVSAGDALAKFASASTSGSSSGRWELATRDGVEGFEHSTTGEFVDVASATADVVADMNDAKTHDMTNKTDTGVGDLDNEDVGFIKRLRQKFDFGDDDVDIEKALDGLGNELDAASLEKALDVVKEGRSLNESNLQALMAAHDAIEMAVSSELSDDKQYQTNRFSDNQRFEFDLSDYSEKIDDGDTDKSVDDVSSDLEKLTGEQGEHVIEAVDSFVESQGLATFGEFREWAWHQHDDLDDEVLFALDVAIDEYRTYHRNERDSAAITEEFAGWLEAEANIDLTMADSLNEKLDELNEKLDEAEKRIDELEGDSSQKNTDGDGDGDGAAKDGDGDADADVDADKVDDLNEKVDDISERLDKVSAATADTQQLDKSGADENEGGRTNDKAVWTR